MRNEETRAAPSTGRARREPLAIVGLDAMFPGSSDGAGYWRSLFAGSDQFRDIPESHWSIDDYYDPDPAARDKTYGQRGAFLDEIEFDPLEWGIPPSIIPATDTSQLLALIVAQRVLDDATSGRFREMDRSRISVILGVTGGQELLGSMVARLQRPVWERALRDSGVDEAQIDGAVDRILAHYVEWQESTFPGLLGNVVAGRIANRLDLGGTNCITDAACASSISAMAMAANELHLGDSDLVITGGVDTMNSVFMYMCFSKTPALSPTGDCRPFSAQANGTMLGEGLGMIALKRLDDAERDGDSIYAVVRGIGASSDGRAKSVYAPLSTGQARALRRAYDVAGFGPESVELVEAHGTGTTAGDAAEVQGLRTVFVRERPRRRAVVRPGVSQGAHRPHQVGGGRRRGDQGRPGLAAPDPAASAKGRRAEPGTGARAFSLLRVHRGTPLGPVRRPRASCRRELVRIRRVQLPRGALRVRGAIGEAPTLPILRCRDRRDLRGAG